MSAHQQSSTSFQSFRIDNSILEQELKPTMDLEIQSVERSRPHTRQHSLSGSTRKPSFADPSFSGIETKRDESIHDEYVGKLSLKDRLKHFTFAWFACTMSTGGIAFVLSVMPNRFPGLTTIGTIIFIANIFLFMTFTTLMITRFIIHPGTFTHAFTNPHEGFFSATFWLSFATMITNSTAYGIPSTGPWLITALKVAFWIYTFCATVHAVAYYFALFTVKRLQITNVLPGWVLPVFPAMLVGTLAAAIAKTQPPDQALPILVAGLSYQGLGIMVAFMMYPIYFGRLLTSGLPVDMSRPAMFIAAGPPAFTALAFIGMAQNVAASGLFATGYLRLEFFANLDPVIVPEILQLLALIAGIFFWVTSFWFFALALVATIEALPRNNFHLNWYAYIFPNVGFMVATVKIGQVLQSSAVQAVGTGMGVMLFVVWILVGGAHIRAVWTKQICWPGKDEDSH